MQKERRKEKTITENEKQLKNRLKAIACEHAKCYYWPNAATTATTTGAATFCVLSLPCNTNSVSRRLKHAIKACVYVGARLGCKAQK